MEIEKTIRQQIASVVGLILLNGDPSLNIREQLSNCVLHAKVFLKFSSKFTGKQMWKCHNQVNKQLQYTYYPISHKVKATKHWNLVNY